MPLYLRLRRQLSLLHEEVSDIDQVMFERLLATSDHFLDGISTAFKLSAIAKRSTILGTHTFGKRRILRLRFGGHLITVLLSRSISRSMVSLNMSFQAVGVLLCSSLISRDSLWQAIPSKTIDRSFRLEAHVAEFAVIRRICSTLKISIFASNSAAIRRTIPLSAVCDQ